MPLYDYRCDDGHCDERYFAAASQAGDHLPCRLCGQPAHKQFSVGRGLCYFEEGRARRIWNLERSDERDKDGNLIPSKPVYVRSAEEHKRLMRQRGVDFANKGRGYSGQWI